MLLITLICLAAFEPSSMLSREGLVLPPSARVIGVGSLNGEDTDRLRIDESAGWISGVQEQPEGDLGFVPRDLTYSNGSSTLVYDIKTRRGVRDHRQADTGTTRLDGLVTPYAWVRRAEHAQANGGSVRVSEHGGRLLHRVEAPRGFSPFTCVVDPESRELLRVEVENGATPVTFTYSEWREVCPGRHLPMRITMEIAESRGQQGILKTYTIVEATCRDNDVSPPAQRLSDEAVIDDRLQGRIIRADGSPADVPHSGTHAAQASRTWRAFDAAFIGGGILLLAGSAIWYRRKVMR